MTPAARLRRRRRRAAGVWGAAGLVVLGAGLAVALTAQPGSTAGSSTGTVSTTGTTPGSTGNGNGPGGGNNGQGAGNGAAAGAPGKSLTVVGATASGRLGPGVQDTVLVTVSNPNSSDVLVTRVTGTVTSVTEVAGRSWLPDAVPCDAAWYRLQDFTGSQRIAGRGTGQVPMTVRFDSRPGTNQDRCKGATYRFSVTAYADQAR